MPSSSRIRLANAREPNASADFVLYWMTTARRAHDNFALERAVRHAAELEKPLVVFEGLRTDYPWASPRLSRFAVEGMLDNARDFAKSGAHYYAHVETEPGKSRGLLAALAEHAALVVTDEFPTFFLPRMIEAAAEKLRVPLEVVDSCGILPLSSSEKPYPSAYTFRRFMQKTVEEHLDLFPKRHPLSRRKLKPLERLPAAITKRWPALDVEALAKQDDGPAWDAVLPKQGPGRGALTGGSKAGTKRLAAFMDAFGEYDDLRNQPDESATSRLSSYLHFGHVSPHQVFLAITGREGWSPDDLTDERKGQRTGFWGMSPEAEAFMDQLVTWRELGYHFCRHVPNHEDFASLPDWARQTLQEHASDPRPHVYTLEQFDAGDTHDELWNAAQNELRSSGLLHNYMRMVWGKKILEWSATPEEALETMIELNNRYALDGRNPNSISGITWTLGRFDRPWGPERPIFGKIRYMSTDNTRRKLRLKQWLAKWSAPAESGTLF